MDGEGWDTFVFRCGWNFALKKMWVLLELVAFRVKGTQHVSTVAVGGMLKRAKVWPWIWLLSAVPMYSSGNYQTVTVTRFSKLQNTTNSFSVFIIHYSILWKLSYENKNSKKIQTYPSTIEFINFELWVMKIEWWVIKIYKSQQSQNISFNHKNNNLNILKISIYYTRATCKTHSRGGLMYLGVWNENWNQSFFIYLNRV